MNRGRLVSLVVLVLVTSTPTPARAVPRPLSEALSGDAKTEYDLGRGLYRSGDFAGALVKFQRAFTLSSDPRLLWNMAACEKGLHRYKRVLEDVDKYLASAVLSEAEQAEATKFRDAIRALVSDVTLDVSEPGATVSVDDEAIGTTPLSTPVVMGAGLRRIRVSKPGFRDYVKSAEVPGGAPLVLAIPLVREQRDAHLIVNAREADAIAVDEKTVGIAEWTGALSPGTHVVVVRGKGKRPQRIEVSLREAETRTLGVTLESESRTVWPWLIAGGAVVAAGAAVGGYFLFRPSPSPPPPQGTAGGFQL
jgi:hypothetical protein